MKLLKIYSNDEKNFHSIKFNDGLNVIIAEITDKTKTEREIHNLGKTFLISVIDFLLLKNISNKSKYFLTKGSFEGQIFFAELILNDGSYLVIRRSINNPTKISFKKNKYKLNSFKIEIAWDQEYIPLKNAKQMLNEYLNYDILPNWTYRKPVTYFLRTQNDFRDVFKLDKFKSRDKDWKPFMFDLLGFDGSVILGKYELEDDKAELKSKIVTLQQEANINVEEKDKIEGLIDIRQDEKVKIEANIDKFNFYEKDKIVNQELVEDIDTHIQILNTKRYNCTSEIKKIETALSTKQNAFDIDKLKELYKDVEIYFPDDLSKDFQALINFNKAVTEERNVVLEENLDITKRDLATLDAELKEYEKQKEELLSYLTQKDSYEKFKEAQKQLAKTESDIIRLKDKLEAIDRSSLLIKDIEKKDQLINDKIKEIKSLISEQRHSEVRKIFNAIIKEILNTNALLSLKQNKEGNVEFEANIQNPKDLTITEEDYGMTYRKLLCMAFDLSILIHYSKNSFYRFVYHDGALEALDDRKKIKFIDLIKTVCRDYNLQYILTLIDSDLPKNDTNEIISFNDTEICLRLNDRNDDGKLFRKSF